MKKTFLVLGAIMFAFLFAGCKGAEDTSSEGLKEALLELADDDSDAFIEKLFEDPKLDDTIKLSIKDSDTLIIKNLYYPETPLVATFTLTDDGVKVTIEDSYFSVKDSFIIARIEIPTLELVRREAKLPELTNLIFSNENKSKFLRFTFDDATLHEFSPDYLYVD